MVLVCILPTETSALDLPPHNLDKCSVGIRSQDRYKDGRASSKFHQIHNHHNKISQPAWYWCMFYSQQLRHWPWRVRNLWKRSIGISSVDRHKDGTASSKFHHLMNMTIEEEISKEEESCCIGDLRCKQQESCDMLLTSAQRQDSSRSSKSSRRNTTALFPEETHWY